jgi:2-amino-4-hydroxy-6-hydroxymethyldihydropteridine diphosphokinase
MWLGLGSNLGEREDALLWALTELTERGLVVQSVSGAWETAPQGVEDQPEFLNAACRVSTALGPRDALRVAKEIEADAGRVDGPRWGPRPLDIDILVWDAGTWDDADLQVPHPRLHERRFALQPLAEVEPLMVLPDGRSVAELLAAIPPQEQPVRRIGDLA